jgi:hypothetical protein
MLADAAKRPGIALSYGDDLLISIASSDYEVPLDKGAKRPDTSATELYVKLALAEKDNVQKVMAQLSAFIKKARVSGSSPAASSHVSRAAHPLSGSGLSELLHVWRPVRR